MRILVFAALTLSGCSAAGGGSGPSDAPVECMKTDRIGTYLSHFDTLSGNCGPVSDSVVRNDVISMVLPAGCSFLADDRWSDGDCRVERAYRCDNPDGSGEFLTVLAATTQQTSDGDSLTGAATITVTNASGAELCRGTYRLTYTRQ